MPSGPDEDELLDEHTLEVTVSRDMRGIIEHSSKEQALLIVLSEPRLGARLLLAEATIEIGRGTAGGLVLDADSVSRRHARVEWTGRAHRLVDQDSTNGTFVNGVRVTSQELKDGDRVQIGKVLLKYIAGGNIEANYHEEVQRLMRYDALTGVYNKRHFEECLRVAVTAARANPRRVSLVVFDLDHFKRINDTHGHVAGDVVLCELAKVARDVLIGDVVFGRVGGEEFAALWEGAGLSAMVELAEKMRKATASHPFRYEGAKLGVTISAGVAERLPEGDEAATALYDRADAKLYEAKEAGRNCVKA